MPKSHKLKLISLDHFEIQVEKINSFLSRGKFCHLLINSANSLDPDVRMVRMLVLMWIHTVRHSEGVSERIFLNS